MRLIDADALSDLLVETYEKAPTEKALLFVALLLKNNEQVPTIEERPQGKWVKITKDGVMPIEYICNVCGRTVKSYYEEYLIEKVYPFCHCGAKMKGCAE